MTSDWPLNPAVGVEHKRAGPGDVARAQPVLTSTPAGAFGQQKLDDLAGIAIAEQLASFSRGSDPVRFDQL